jgi:hypothetical protein
MRFAPIFRVFFLKLLQKINEQLSDNIQLSDIFVTKKFRGGSPLYAVPGCSFLPQGTRNGKTGRRRSKRTSSPSAPLPQAGEGLC